MRKRWSRWYLWKIQAEENSLLIWSPWLCVVLYDRGYHFVTQSIVTGYELWWDFDPSAIPGMICFRKHVERFREHIPLESYV